MARKLRIFGEQRINHVIIRGINKQNIFLDRQDNKKFLNEISRVKEKFDCELYAYVLMPNHVHLQLYDKKENLSEIMHNLQIRYVAYFNKKYERIGHLFQDRYKHKIIEDHEYFSNCIRYIHNNPENAFITKVEKYEWSSYNAYIRKDNTLVNTDEFLSMLDDGKIDVIEKFKQYHTEYRKNEISDYIQYELQNKLTDEQLTEILKEKWNMNNIQNIQQYNNKIIKKLISEIINEQYISINQIARVTGISRKIIMKIKK